MPIRHYLLIIIFACTLGGIGLAGTLHQWFQRIESRHHEVGGSSVTLKEISHLQGSLSRLLITADLVLGSNESHLAEDGIEQCREILAILDELQGRPVLIHSAKSLSDSQRLLSTIEEQLNTVYRSVDHDALDPVAMLDEFDRNSERIIDQFEKLDRQSKAAAAALRVELENERSLLFNSTIGGLVVYLLAAFLLGRWAWRRIASPLQDLTVSAHRSMSEGLHFEHGSDGPREVKELSATIGESINLLEDKVDERTE